MVLIRSRQLVKVASTSKMWRTPLWMKVEMTSSQPYTYLAPKEILSRGRLLTYSSKILTKLFKTRPRPTKIWQWGKLKSPGLMNANATTAAALSNYDDEIYRFCFFSREYNLCERPRGYLSKSDDPHVLNMRKICRGQFNNWVLKQHFHCTLLYVVVQANPLIISSYHLTLY